MSRVDAHQPPPARYGYVVAGAVAVLALLAAVAVLVVGIRSWTGDFPTLGRHFRAGESARLELRAGEPAVLYVSPDTATFDGRCTGEVAGSPITVTEASDTFTFF